MFMQCSFGKYMSSALKKMFFLFKLNKIQLQVWNVLENCSLEKFLTTLNGEQNDTRQGKPPKKDF